MANQTLFPVLYQPDDFVADQSGYMSNEILWKN